MKNSKFFLITGGSLLLAGFIGLIYSFPFYLSAGKTEWNAYKEKEMDLTIAAFLEGNHLLAAFHLRRAKVAAEHGTSKNNLPQMRQEYLGLVERVKESIPSGAGKEWLPADVRITDDKDVLFGLFSFHPNLLNDEEVKVEVNRILSDLEIPGTQEHLKLFKYMFTSEIEKGIIQEEILNPIIESIDRKTLDFSQEPK